MAAEPSQQQRRPRETNFTDIGVAGRKTGFTVKDNVARDELGMEDMDNFFSPEKSPEKTAALQFSPEASNGHSDAIADNTFTATSESHTDPSGAGHTITEASMDVVSSSVVEPTALLTERRRQVSLPPRARSPAKFNIQGSPRRGSSIGPTSSPQRHSSPMRPAGPAANRRLDFSLGGGKDNVFSPPQAARKSGAQPRGSPSSVAHHSSSPPKANGRTQAPGKGKQLDSIADEEEETARPTPPPKKQKRGLMQNKKRSVGAKTFDFDLSSSDGGSDYPSSAQKERDTIDEEASRILDEPTNLHQDVPDDVDTSGITQVVEKEDITMEDAPPMEEQEEGEESEMIRPAKGRPKPTKPKPAKAQELAKEDDSRMEDALEKEEEEPEPELPTRGKKAQAKQAKAPAAKPAAVLAKKPAARKGKGKAAEEQSSAEDESMVVEEQPAKKPVARKGKGKAVEEQPSAEDESTVVETQPTKKLPTRRGKGKPEEQSSIAHESVGTQPTKKPATRKGKGKADESSVADESMEVDAAPIKKRDAAANTKKKVAPAVNGRRGKKAAQPEPESEAEGQNEEDPEPEPEQEPEPEEETTEQDEEEEVRPAKRSRKAAPKPTKKSAGKQATKGKVATTAAAKRPPRARARSPTPPPSSSSSKEPVKAIKSRDKGKGRATEDTAEELDRKGSQRIIHEKPAPPQLAPEDEGKRRSSRQKVAPLQYWLGEKVVYSLGERRKSGPAMPMMREIVRVDMEEEKKREAERRAARSESYRRRTPAPEGPKTGTKRKRSAGKTVPSIEEDVEMNEVGEPEDWELEGGVKNGFIKSWPLVKNELGEEEHVETELAFAKERMVTVKVANSDFTFVKTLSTDFFGTGLVEFEPGTVKHTKSSGKMLLVFYVVHGRATVRIGSGEYENIFRVGAGGQFMIPRGNLYSIENEFDSELKLFFAQGCTVNSNTDASQSSQE